MQSLFGILIAGIQTLKSNGIITKLKGPTAGRKLNFKKLSSALAIFATSMAKGFSLLVISTLKAFNMSL